VATALMSFLLGATLKYRRSRGCPDIIWGNDHTIVSFGFFWNWNLKLCAFWYLLYIVCNIGIIRTQMVIWELFITLCLRYH